MKKFLNYLTNTFIIFGIILVCYPLVSQYYYHSKTKQDTQNFQTEAKHLSKNDINNRIHWAKQYNQALNTQYLKDPYNQQTKNAKEHYARLLELDEKIGILDIPKIKVSLPIYPGASEHSLQKGIGHLEGTSLPIGGQSTHAVLTGHRGLPNARLFTDLDQLTSGDIFYIENLSTILAYKVDQVKVIEPTNFKDLLIVPDKDYVTLLTCTPYMINSHRLIVRGHRIDYHPETKKQLEKKYQYHYPVMYFIVPGIVILLVIVFIVRMRRKR